MPDHDYRGFLLVLSSPSGAGKTTLTRRLLGIDSALTLSVSVTTRHRRPNEIDGVHYDFIDRKTFDAMVEQNELLEHATVFGNSYGTPRYKIDALLAAGKEVVADLDWQGTRQLKEKVPDDLVTVFILPPSVKELERRLTERNQDSAEVVRARMAQSLDEISHWPEYEYVLVNDDLDVSLATLEAIIRTEQAARRHSKRIATPDDMALADRTRRVNQPELAELVDKITGR